MAELQVKSRILEGRYVFYERLLTDPKAENQLLGETARRSINRIDDVAPLMHTDAISNLYYMAQVEAEKEANLLSRVFSVNIPVEPYNKDFYSQLIDALNRTMGIEKVYERNVKKIMNDETSISVARFYPTYFNQAYTAAVPDIIQEMTDLIGKTRSKVTIGRIAEQVLRKYMPEINKDAIRRMFSSADVNHQLDSDHSYEELIESFDNLEAGDEFARQLYELYDLDDLTKTLAKSVKENTKQNRYDKLIKKGDRAENIPMLHPGNEASLGGELAEYLENFIVNGIVSARTDGSITITAYHSGKSKMKADNIMTFNIDPSPVMEAIESATNDRSENVAALTKLGHYLRDLRDPDSFIIYSNAKNYSLGDSFSSRGFSSGEDITVARLEEILLAAHQNPQRVNAFIGAIVNTLEGALGADKIPILEEILATDFAYFLFDDVETLGKESGGAQVLHLFNLDGIYIPLSLLCYLLAEALEDAEATNYKKVIDAYIRPNGVEIFPPGRDSGYFRWVAQRNIANSQMQVGVKFLKNFVSLIKSLKLLN